MIKKAGSGLERGSWGVKGAQGQHLPAGPQPAPASPCLPQAGAGRIDNPQLAIDNRQLAIGNGRSWPIRSRVLIFLALVALGGVAYLFYRPRPSRPLEIAFVLPETLDVVDTPAEIRLVIATLQSGEQLQVLERSRNWTQVRLADGRTGWVESKDLLDAATQQRAEQLLQSLADLSAQAVGHTDGVVNLRLEPSRDATQLAQLPQNQKVEVFGRRVVERPPAPESPGQPASPAREAWYLVRVNSRPAARSPVVPTGGGHGPAGVAAGRAGWVLGRFVELDIPPALSMYAQETNVVAWLVLNTVDDGGQQIPQYVVADRVGTQELDFNHLRVFTWWVKRHRYATAYVESRLNGYFPIRVGQRNGTPYFRLRLMDDAGRKFQKVYGLFDTITRPVGTVDGWESDAMPSPAVSRPPGRRQRARGRRQ